MYLKKHIELVKEKEISKEYITYSEKLNTLEWRNIRNYIVSRDNYLCSNCGSSPTEYQNGKPVRKKTKKEVQEYKNYLGKLWFNSVKEEYKDEYNPKNPPWFLQQKIRVPLNIEENPIILHVHHKYYILNNLPWEYPKESLITLCHNCHQNIHDRIKTPVYLDKSKTKEIETKICEKCNGSGYLPKFHYYESGICFSCHGNKYMVVDNTNTL